MKIKIGPYKNFFGPYQLAELLCFWVPKVEKQGVKEFPDWVHNFGQFLSCGKFSKEDISVNTQDQKDTIISKVLKWLETKRSRKVYVKIDYYDIWNADHTLAIIILPVLRKFKDCKQGAPWVDCEDVPPYLRPSKENNEEYNINGSTDDKFFDRWDYVLDCMIWSFEQIIKDEDFDEFSSGESDWFFKEREDGFMELKEGPNHTLDYDFEARKKYDEKIQEGLRLFGKYYRSLWS